MPRLQEGATPLTCFLFHSEPSITHPLKPRSSYAFILKLLTQAEQACNKEAKRPTQKASGHSQELGKERELKKKPVFGRLLLLLLLTRCQRARERNTKKVLQLPLRVSMSPMLLHSTYYTNHMPQSICFYLLLLLHVSPSSITLLLSGFASSNGILSPNRRGSIKSLTPPPPPFFPVSASSSVWRCRESRDTNTTYT